MTAPRGRSDAFSLPELTVALAAVAVMLPVLLAALRHTVEQRRSARCASNARQVAAAFRAYAAERDGAIPPGCNGLRRGPFESYVAYRKDPGESERFVPWGVAHLFEQEYVTDARAFYCPESRGTRAYAYNAPWGEQTPTRRDGSEDPCVRTSYLFFPYASEANALRGAVAERPADVSRAKPSDIVLVDEILEGASRHGDGHWNVGAVDGSAKRVRGAWVTDDIDVASLHKGWLGHAWKEFRTVRTRLSRTD